MENDSHYKISSVIGDQSAFASLVGPISVGILIPCGIFGGTLADNYNRRWIMSGCMVVGGLTTAGMSICNAYWQMVIFRLLLGITGGFFVPAVTGLFIDYFPEKQRTQALAMMGNGILVAMALN